nr:MAG TPA: hypothetical protein [Caudoviricetes sp.]
MGGNGLRPDLTRGYETRIDILSSINPGFLLRGRQWPTSRSSRTRLNSTPPVSSRAPLKSSPPPRRPSTRSVRWVPP